LGLAKVPLGAVVEHNERSEMRKVLVFKETLLPPSETFILAQMKELQRYQPMLTGLERTEPSLPLKQDTLLLTDSATGYASMRAKLYRQTGIAPGFHTQAAKFEPKLVHAHFSSGGLTAVHLAKRLGVPLLVTLHGGDITVRGEKADGNKRLSDRAVLFICVSEFIRERALEAGFAAEKLIVHHIGIDREMFALPATQEPSKRILFIGRLVEKKGCEYLLRAMQVLQKTHPDAELTILGDGPMRPEMEALAKELKIHCDFRGFQPATTVRDMLQQTRLVCVPSVTAANGDSEGLPTVIAEAQAMGIPVVASIHAGIPEIVIDGKTGILAAERDFNALADGMSQLLADVAMWSRFHDAALARIRDHFDLKTQTALLEDIYDRAVALK
jgi:colanic acid/amylovoran biosynthesis glycosyltransferase